MSDNAVHAASLTRSNFDAETGHGLALVDFWAPWCGPCRAMGPVVDELAAELGGQALVAKVNVDEEEVLAARFGVMTIPSLFVLKDGEVVKHFVGVQPKETLKKALLAAAGN